MEENLINLETAKLAKEKGFTEKTHNYFSQERYEKTFSLKNGFNDEYWGDNWYYDWNTNGEPFKPFSKNCFSAPTQSLLQKWLRDVHKINLYISYEVIDDSEVAYVWNIIIDIPEGTGRKKDSWDFIKRISSFSEKYMMWYKNYEEALEAGLQEALKLI